MPDELREVFAETFLHRRPVGPVEPLLIVDVNPHEEVVADEVRLCERPALGIQALEDKVWIVVPLKNDTDQDQLADDNLLEFLQIGNLGGSNLPLEEFVGSRDLVVGGTSLPSHD